MLSISFRWELKMWKKIEEWGVSHPVMLTVFGGFFGFVIGFVPAGWGGYNLGFYAGVTTTERQWRDSFNNKVDMTVNEQIASKCGEVTAEINNSCNRQIRRLESTIKEKDDRIEALQYSISRLQQKSDVLELHERLTDNANNILSALLAARERRDTSAELTARSRVLSLLNDIHRTNSLFNEWASLFNGVATELFNRLQSGESIPSEQLVAFLRSFIADNDRKRKVIQTGVDAANKIKTNKY
jgi:hypothetical protein